VDDAWELLQFAKGATMTKTVALMGVAVLAAAVSLPMTAGSQASTAPDGATFTSDGQMKLPANYREWVFLSSGLDINYNPPGPTEAGHSVFQNVFVNPSAYKSFLATGTWPDKTVLVLEIRGAASKAGIDRHGQTQAAVRAIEVHVKDEAHIPGKWGFYEFGKGGAAAKLVGHSADCYTCHEAHAAVDTTFVQFYPTLIDLAKDKGTLSAAYVKELAAAPVDGANR
jgi:hypothetical protein